MSRRRLWIGVSLLAVSVIIFGGCAPQEAGPVATMELMAESHLSPFPGATSLGTGNYRQLTGVARTDYVYRDFGIDAEESALVAYYQDQLQPLGWTRDCSTCDIWHKPGYRFELDIQSPPVDPSYQMYQLVFKEVLSQETTASPGPAASSS